MGILKRVLHRVPEELVATLETEFQALESRFSRGDWAHAELNAGRFAEGILRVLEWKRTGHYTAIGEQVDRLRIVREVEGDIGMPEGLRFLVCKSAEVLLDLRNRRDVAHLGQIKGVSAMDSALVMGLASWMLAEIVREEGGASPEEAEMLIEKLSARHIPLVEEVGGDVVIVGESLTATTRALLALYHSYPRPVAVDALLGIVGYENSSRFIRLLETQRAKGIVHLKNGDAYLTRKGIAWLEKNVDMEVRV